MLPVLGSQAFYKGNGSVADHIDEFESIFRRSERELFQYSEIPLQTVTLVSDGDAAAAEKTLAMCRQWLPCLSTVTTWRSISGDQYRTVSELLERLDEQQTDLIITRRHLHEESFVPQHSLGVYLDVMTQTTSIPVLVLPGSAAAPAAPGDHLCDRVMVVADHINGDNRLINYGVRMCREGGTIWLCHVEDNAIFERYMRAIARIPEIDSDDARILIEKQLLSDAREFINGCAEVIHDKGPNITVNSFVGRGHHLRDYRELIDQHDVELLVLNTKDDDQLAMHGRAYSLSVELVDVSMLLL